MKLNPKVFKSYDIRGIYPEEINEEAAHKIGQAFVGFLQNTGQIGNRQIIVGRDARISSDDLFEALTDGITSQSVDVVDIGLVSTPQFYWTIIKERAAGGVMITASHNPAQYNGFKLCSAEARSIGEYNGLLKIMDLAMESQAAASFMPGKVRKKNLLAEYLVYIKQKADIEKIKPFKIVIDCGNGTMGPEVKELFRDLPCQTEILFVEPDGCFPNHEANPLKEETLKILRENVLSSKADLGVAFDGDGDRVVFLDEKGEAVRGDIVTALIAKQLLKQYPGKKIFYEVRSSRIVPEIIRENGGTPILGRAGHSLIKNQMRQENIFFGGELSGHYFFETLGVVDNALYATLKILEILSEEQKPFSEIVKPLKKYYHSGEINFSVSNVDAILKEVEGYFSGGQAKKIDGITVEYPDWWFNLRRSSTEPLVRLNLEASSQELMEKKIKQIKKIIENGSH